MPSVTYEAFYKKKGNGREKDLWFTLLLDGGDYGCEWLRAIVELGEVEEFREGTLEPRSAHLY